MPADTPSTVARRQYLAALGALAGGASLAGCSLLEAGADAETTGLPADRARDLAERFAPTLYFDAREQWFPTDPRPYRTERDGAVVVDGFRALDGYTARSRGSDAPPEPVLFYRALGYEGSPLAAVQFWYYSVFDQFTTNFHWHDWEVVQVFVDTDTGDPQLYVASAHSGQVPNNEYLDPDPGRAPRVLSELGSHSSALSVNGLPDQFRRLPEGDTLADITNSAIEGLERLADVPVAYGLPRDEGSRLPYLVPELDGAPVYEHENLPSVGREDLLPADLTVGSFAELLSPPTELPERATGPVFGFADSPEVDVAYDLVPTSELEDVSAFTGPQLSFEFAVPRFAEDAVAAHITTTDPPWDQPRYDAPAADISDPVHRRRLADRYDALGEPGPANTVVAAVTEAVAADDAPDGEGLTTRGLPVESVALLESEPAAVPTFGGLAVLGDVPGGEHRLTVNGPGVEPHAETVPVADDGTGPATAGVGGEVPLVARENATKLAVDTEGADADLTDLAVEDDFAGRLYDAPLSGPDAVYLHRGGAYTTELRDADDEIGAVRVNPTDEARVAIEEPRTGKGSLAEYLADVAAETAAAVAAVDGDDTDDGSSGGSDSGGSANAVRGLARALEAVAEAASRAAERAAAGDRSGADRRLAAVRDRLDTVAARLADARGDLPDDLERAVDHRSEQLDRRSRQAREAGKL